MERWTRRISRVRSDRVAVVAVGLAALLLLAALAVAAWSGTLPPESLAVAAAFPLFVAAGLSLYAWRLGAPGRSG